MYYTVLRTETSCDRIYRMRVAMGLKPLKADGGPEAREAKERAAGKAHEEERRKKIEAASLRERIETCVTAHSHVSMSSSSNFQCFLPVAGKAQEEERRKETEAVELRERIET